MSSCSSRSSNKKMKRKAKNNNGKSLNEIWTKLTELHPTCYGEHWPNVPAFYAHCAVFLLLHCAIRCWWSAAFFFIILDASASAGGGGGGAKVAAVANSADHLVLVWCFAWLDPNRLDLTWLGTARHGLWLLNQVRVCARTWSHTLGFADTHTCTHACTVHSSTAITRCSAVQCSARLHLPEQNICCRFNNLKYIISIILFRCVFRVRCTRTQVGVLMVCALHTSNELVSYMWMILILLGFANLATRSCSFSIRLLLLLVLFFSVFFIHYLFQVICVCFLFCCSACPFISH